MHVNYVEINYFLSRDDFIFIQGLNSEPSISYWVNWTLKKNKLFQGIKNEKENNFILRNTRMVFHCLEGKNKETDWRLWEIQSERKEERKCIALQSWPSQDWTRNQLLKMAVNAMIAGLPRRNDREPNPQR